MAPNKKKKKAAGNPARGFATVSQPSKSARASALDDQKDEDVGESRNGPQVGTLAHTTHAISDSSVPNLQAMSPEEFEAHLEDAELQNVIETSSSRCKQDASRQVRKLESERRQLRSQAHKLSSVSLLSNDLMNQVLDQRSDRQSDSLSNQCQTLFDDTDLLLKAWTLRIVLLSLQLPSVDIAIEHVLISAAQSKLETSIDYVWGLQEALEFYARDSQEQDILEYDKLNDTALRSPIETATPSIDGSVTDTATEASEAPPVSPQTHLPSITSSSHSEQDIYESLSELSPTDSEDDDPSNLVSRYIKLQTLLFHTKRLLELTTQRPDRYEKRKARLEKRLSSIHRDVLFDADSADILWQQTLRELTIDASRSAKAREVNSQSSKTAQKSPDHTEEESLLGDMFGMTEGEHGVQSVSKPQATIRTINFGKWTGIAPRRLMEESCHSLDGHYLVKFHTLSATSHSSRQRVEVRWTATHQMDEHALASLPQGLELISASRILTIDMASLATDNLSQAESYLSTVVLFLLAHSGYADSRQVNRLPTIWRDVCADLTQARQLLVDAADKVSLKDLRGLIEDIRARLHEVDRFPLGGSDPAADIPIGSSRDARPVIRFTADEAVAQWNSRESSTSYQKMLEVRSQLPVHHYRQNILQAVNENPLVIICADTGAGKSTQVPSFVLEHHLARGQDYHVLVTQPRRISAISLARRVSQELGEHKKDIGTNKSLVGYAIRLESKTSTTTRITFATTGVLLRMIEASPQLDNLDCLIIDEVHERTMDIDLLFIALRRLQQRRAGLKIILMSATIDAQKFSNYFGGAPVLNLPGRTFPVEVRFLEDAIEDTLDVGSRTGAAIFNMDEEDGSDYEEDRSEKTLIDAANYSPKTRSVLSQMDERRIDFELTASLAEAVAKKDKYVQYSAAILIFMPGIAEIKQMHNALLRRDIFTSKWIIHLLHSSFSTEDLERAFTIPPRGYRKIVIATNIAETGITIPDVTTVIDTCKERIMRFNERRQLSRLTEGFISRASARQRRGRAARVQEGLCFHLVTRHRFEELMLEQNVPEMMRLSLQDPILRIKIWNLGSIEETLAAAIDPPTRKNVRRAVDKLRDAGALNVAEDLTPLGKLIAKLPLEVVLSKLAIFGVVFQCLDSILCIVAILSSKSPFLPNKNNHQDDPRLAFARADSDLVSSLNAYQGWKRSRAASAAHQYCKKHQLSDQNLSAIEDQKIQLLVYLVDAGLLQFEHGEKTALSRARLSSQRGGFFNIPDRYNTHDSDSMLNCIIAMAFYPKVLVREGKGWRNVFTNQRVNLTSTSVTRASERPPKWLCFYEAVQARSGSLNVLETSKIPEIVIVTILGSAEMKFFSGVIGLDNGRMKFSVRHGKEMAVIKKLRETLAAVLDRCWRTPGLRLSLSEQTWIELFANLVSGKDTKLR